MRKYQQRGLCLGVLFASCYYSVRLFKPLYSLLHTLHVIITTNVSAMNTQQPSLGPCNRQCMHLKAFNSLASSITGENNTSNSFQFITTDSKMPLKLHMLSPMYKITHRRYSWYLAYVCCQVAVSWNSYTISKILAPARLWQFIMTI